MPRGKYFLLLNYLKVIDDNTVHQQTRTRPGCLTIPRPKDCCIDEKIISFTCQVSIRKFIGGKPNPTGLKNFVIASPDGTARDFEIFQG